MERSRPTALYALAPDHVERATRELDAAIALVAQRSARVVHVTGLAAVEAAAALAAAHAQQAAVAFRIERDVGGGASAVVGPAL